LIIIFNIIYKKFVFRLILKCKEEICSVGDSDTFVFFTHKKDKVVGRDYFIKVSGGIGLIITTS